jgi:hypothetical protein
MFHVKHLRVSFAVIALFNDFLKSQIRTSAELTWPVCLRFREQDGAAPVTSVKLKASQPLRSEWENQTVNSRSRFA